MKMTAKNKKAIKPADNNSNMKNSNKKSNGTNLQYDKVHGNRGKQLNEQKGK